MTKGRKIALRTIAGAAVIVASFLAVEHLRGAWGLRSHLNQLKARNEPLSLASLKPAPVIANSNAAEVFLPVNGDQSKAKVALELWPPMCRMVAPGRAVVGSRLAVWGKPAKPGSALGPPPDWEQLRAALAANAEFLERLRSCIKRPAYNSGFDYDAGFAKFQSSPLAPLKGAVQLLSASALLALHDGNQAAACADALLQIRLCDHLAEEPLLISQLVRMAAASIALNTTWEMLQAEGITDEQLASLQEAWRGRDYLPAMLRSLETERVMSLEYSRQIKPSSAIRQEAVEQLINPLLLFGEDEPRNEFILKWIHVPVWRVAWADQDTLHHLKRWDRVLALGRCAQTNAWKAVVEMSGATTTPDLTRSGSDDDETLNPNFYDRCRYLFSGRSLGVSERLLSRAMKMETHRNLAVAAIAVQRYPLRHVRLPATLAELVPEFLHQIPMDRMDGEPLRYRPGTEGAFLLYSVGEDLRDDGGDASPSAQQLYLWNCRDAVWPLSASAEEVEQARKDGKLE